MIDRGETSCDRACIDALRMKSYLGPLAAVLFRALAEAGPTAGLFLVEPTGEAVADRLCLMRD